MTEPLCSIYALLDPITRKVRYIGKTKRDPQQRLKEHIKSISRSPVNLWIQNLLSRDMQPHVYILSRTVESQAAQKEKHWIAQGRDLGWPLLNASDGGEGCHVTPWKRMAVKLSPKTSIALGKLAEELGIDDVRELATSLLDAALDCKASGATDAPGA